MNRRFSNMVLARCLCAVLLAALVSNCAYFNTFFLARKNFNEAERKRLMDNGIVKTETRKFYNEAIDWSSEILKRHAKSKYVDDCLYFIGVSHYYLNEFFDARTKFDELTRAFPESEYASRARYFKAKSLISSGSFDEAESILLDFLNSPDTSINALAGMTIAEERFKKEDWDELLSIAQKVIDLNPKTKELVEAVYYMGEALFQLGRYEECEKTLLEAASNKMKAEMTFKINSRIALAQAKLGKYENGLSNLESMQNKGKFSDFASRIRLDIGMIYEMMGDDKTAVDAYTKLAGDFPDSIAAKEAWYRIGKLLLKDISQAKEAKDAFSMVMKGSAQTNALWYVDAQNKTGQIDSLLAKIELINEHVEKRAKMKSGVKADSPEKSPGDSADVDLSAGTETADKDSALVSAPEHGVDSPDSVKAEAMRETGHASTDSSGVEPASSPVEAREDSAGTKSGLAAKGEEDSTRKAQELVPAGVVNHTSVVNMGKRVMKPDVFLGGVPNGDIAPSESDTTAVRENMAENAPGAPADSSVAGKPETPKKQGEEGKSASKETDITLMLARARFSLAELFTFSFQRPDSALTQYKIIIEEAPGTEFAVKSEYFIGLNELHSKGEFSDETEKALMTSLVKKYPESEFVQDLKVYLGIIEKPSDVRAYIQAEHSRLTGEDPKVYIPLYQAVVDNFPETKTSYQARFMIAYAYEHYAGDSDKAFELYSALAEEKPTVNSEVYVNLAKEKLKFAEEEEGLLEEIDKSIAYYDMILEGRYEDIERLMESGGEAASLQTGREKGYTGYKKIRARNARIRSRYYSQ